jgi:hypothetical protein
MPLPFSENSIGDPKLRHRRRSVPKMRVVNSGDRPRFAQKRDVGAGTNRNDAHFLKLSPRIVSHG